MAINKLQSNYSSKKQKAELKGVVEKTPQKYLVNILARPFESAFCFLLATTVVKSIRLLYHYPAALI